jgi:hypothetical protein
VGGRRTLCKQRNSCAVSLSVETAAWNFQGIERMQVFLLQLVRIERPSIPIDEQWFTLAVMPRSMSTQSRF